MDMQFVLKYNFLSVSTVNSCGSIKARSQRTLGDINSESQRAASRHGCSQGLAGAVAFVLGKCLPTSGASAERVFVLRFSLAAVTFPVRDLK